MGLCDGYCAGAPMLFNEFSKVRIEILSSPDIIEKTVCDGFGQRVAQQCYFARVIKIGKMGRSDCITCYNSRKTGEGRVVVKLRM